MCCQHQNLISRLTFITESMVPGRNAFRTFLFRNFYFSLMNRCMNYVTEREGRYLNRIINKGKRKSLRRQHAPDVTTISGYARSVLYSPETRRTCVLNTIFMEHVSQIAYEGKYAGELYDHGVEIVNVKLSPNLRAAFIYWIHKKPIDEEAVNELLNKLSTAIRYELSSLRIMVGVPELHFVKEKDLMEQEDVEKILADLSIFTEAEKNECTETVETPRNHELESQMKPPQMMQNVYGLKHDDILNNILKQKSGSESLPLWKDNISEVSENNSNHWVFDKKQLSKIVLEKRYLKKKMEKLRKTEFYEDDIYGEINISDNEAEEDTESLKDNTEVDSDEDNDVSNDYEHEDLNEYFDQNEDTIDKSQKN